MNFEGKTGRRRLISDGGIRLRMISENDMLLVCASGMCEIETNECLGQSGPTQIVGRKAKKKKTLLL